MTELGPAVIIDADAEDEHFQVTQNETETHENEIEIHEPLNQPATIPSQETTYYVVFKDVNDENLDANLDEEN